MGEAIPLCGACGAAAFRTTGTCTVCHTHLPAAPVLAPAVAGDARVVCVLLAQRCGHCEVAFPVAVLGDNASTTCSACGKAQTVAFAELRQIMQHARSAAAITPDKKQRSRAVASEVGAGRLTATIHRGHPLCDGCRRPLAITIDGDHATTACDACAIRTSYRRHTIVGRAGGDAVIGVIAGFAALERRDLALEATGDVVALRCPGCGAGVDARSQRVVTCGYCGVVAWVPDRAWSARVPKPPIWLVVRAG